ncbi:uncharacterized protein [Apostichopus japonicus]|uniref:uncharacterized protein isoform X7 n=1 Tax=Stichopus japonicus TaxID=307972 RepID=UPI003AB4A930
MEKFFKFCMTVLAVWNSFGTEMVIVSAEGRSSGISYFVFQQPAYPRDCKEVSNTCSSTHNTSGVYLIKPDGYPEPFEAYCKNDLDSGGWTVLQRRRSDSVNFNRNWKDFRNGFGFLGSEFWIGNEKIAFLTNQKRYQLRMDFENVAGDTYYVTYDKFRISDEWGKYYISSLGTFVKSDGIIPERCPANEIFSNETCERTCDDPDTCISHTSRTETEQCVCVGDYLRQEEQCIPLNQCNCYVTDKGSVLTEGQYYANSGCTRKSTCRNNRLIDESYRCSEHATCDTRTGVRKCYCNQNYQGDGMTCTHNCFVVEKGSVLREGQFHANSGCTRKSTCRNNRLIDESYQCSSHATCDTRNGVRKCYCDQNYQGDGVTCTHNCFVVDKGSVLREGQFHANSGCSRKSTCRNNRLMDESYQCSSHATCDTRSGVRKCYCNQNYHGDGVTCTHNCFVADKGSVLREGQFYANSRCTRKSTCRNNRLTDESYQCSAHATCDTRNGVRKCYCDHNYQGDGVTCTHNCFVADKGSVLREGQFYANSRCTRKSTCRNNRLIDGSYQCSAHATCDTRNNDRKCYCNNGYGGDGVTCTLIPKDCYELYVSGTRSDGVHTIYPDGWPRGIQVYCEMESNGGGWTVIQRRSSAAVDFYRTWAEYKNGFENPSRDHWLGNDYIHAITNQKTYSLRIDLTDSRGSSFYALYSSFSISDEADKYRLSIGSYSGNAGVDSMSRCNNKPFSTRDRDNDREDSYQCAEKHRGAWWFSNHYAFMYSYSYCRKWVSYCDHFPAENGCANCTDAHLNGDYDGSTRGTNIYWRDLSGYDCGLQYTDMKIRPV